MQIPGDAIVNTEAANMQKLCKVALPPQIQKDIKSLRKMKKMDFIKHVHHERVVHLDESDHKRLYAEIMNHRPKKNRRAIAGSSDDDEDPQDELEEKQPEEKDLPTVTAEQVVDEPIVTQIDKTASEPQPPKFTDRRVSKPFMTPAEREQEKGQQRLKRVASASKPAQNKLSSVTSQGTRDIKWLILTKHPVSWSFSTGRRKTL